MDARAWGGVKPLYTKVRHPTVALFARSGGPNFLCEKEKWVARINRAMTVEGMGMGMGMGMEMEMEMEMNDGNRS